VIVSEIYPLSEVGKALAKSRDGHVRAKILLTVRNVD